MFCILYWFTSLTTYSGCWGNTRKVCKSRASGDKRFSGSPNILGGYYAGKSIASAIHRLTISVVTIVCDWSRFTERNAGKGELSLLQVEYKTYAIGLNSHGYLNLWHIVFVHAWEFCVNAWEFCDHRWLVKPTFYFNTVSHLNTARPFCATSKNWRHFFFLAQDLILFLSY